VSASQDRSTVEQIAEPFNHFCTCAVPPVSTRAEEALPESQYYRIGAKRKQKMLLFKVAVSIYRGRRYRINQKAYAEMNTIHSTLLSSCPYQPDENCDHDGQVTKQELTTSVFPLHAPLCGGP
jgi:hypothetical protein